MPRASKRPAAKKRKAKKASSRPTAPRKTPGRRVIYSVAMSLDGYIAGPNGEYDWIVTDPDIDFGAMWSAFDTLLMGRRTFELVASQGQETSSGMKTVVVSRTLRPADYPQVQIISDNVGQAVQQLKAQPGKDIWLFGGGDLFRSLLDAGVVDRVSVAVMPVVIGGGIPFLSTPARLAKLKLTKHKLYRKSGVMSLEYDVV